MKVFLGIISLLHCRSGSGFEGCTFFWGPQIHFNNLLTSQWNCLNTSSVSFTFNVSLSPGVHSEHWDCGDVCHVHYVLLHERQEER